MHITDTLQVLIIIGVVTDNSDVELRLVIVRHSIMLLRRLKAEVILKFVYHALGLGLVAPRNNLIIGLSFLNAPKVTAK